MNSKTVLRNAAVSFIAVVLAGACAQTRPTGPKSGIGPGMNAQGQVVDSSKVEAGYGRNVKGINNWEGEITGKPGAKSRFSKLRVR